MGSGVRISESEWKVMEVVWADPPATAQQVIRALEDKEGWKPQTIKTLLARLVKKKALRTEPDKNRYRYFPQVRREEAVAAETRSFLGRICQGSFAPMLAHFAETGRSLDEDEAAELRKLLKHRSEQAKENS